MPYILDGISHVIVEEVDNFILRQTFIGDVPSDADGATRRLSIVPVRLRAFSLVVQDHELQVGHRAHVMS